MDNTDKIKKLASKLRLLGDTVAELSDTVIISKSKGTKQVECYKLNKGNVERMVYDNVRLVKDEHRKLEVIIGIKNRKQELLDANLNVKSTYIDEQVLEVWFGKYVVLQNPVTSSVRIVTIDGKDVVNRSSFYIESIPVKNKTLVIGCVDRDFFQEYMVLKDKPDGYELLCSEKAEASSDIYAGDKVIAIDYTSSVKIFDYNLKLQLIIKGGTVREYKDAKTKKKTYTVLDKFGHKVLEFEDGRIEETGKV